MQKISKAYFSIPKEKDKNVKEYIYGSPVLKQS